MIILLTVHRLVYIKVRNAHSIFLSQWISCDPSQCSSLLIWTWIWVSLSRPVRPWAASVLRSDMSYRDKLSHCWEPNWCLMLLRSNYGAQMSRANLWLYNVDTWAKERARSGPLWENWKSLLSRCEKVSVKSLGVGKSLQKMWSLLPEVSHDCRDAQNDLFLRWVKILSW